MFELPGYMTLARQLAATVTGKQIREGHLGNLPHKFVRYNRKPGKFESLTVGKCPWRGLRKGTWLYPDTGQGRSRQAVPGMRNHHRENAVPGRDVLLLSTLSGLKPMRMASFKAAQHDAGADHEQRSSAG
jgi:hypothetical protein